MIHKGRVVWFNNFKGYGFIESDDYEDSIFVHYSALLTDGFKSVNEGDEVEFEVTKGPKGLHAQNVKVILDKPIKDNS